MLLHKDCGGKVLIPINGLKVAVDSFGVNPREKNLTLNQITLIDEREGRRSEDITFLCSKCHTIDIPIEDIIMACCNCSCHYEIKNLWIYTGGGGFYCEICKKKICSREKSLNRRLQ